MFVSILQLMGFPMGKPVNSRAKEGAQNQPSNARMEAPSLKASGRRANIKQVGQTFASDECAHEHSARRPDMKPKTGKTRAAAKAVSTIVKAKPVARAKSVAPSRAKPVPKPAKKSLPKSAPKQPARGAVKAPARTVAAKTAKAAPKIIALAAKRMPAKTAKPAVKVKSKIIVKAKESVKQTSAKASKPDRLAVPAKTKPLLAAVKNAVVALPAKPVVAAPAALSAASVPPRAGRPSSRLAQLTVPSMAQSVASTAAKASFTQTVTSPLIVPPLASAVRKDPKLANNWKTKPVEQLTEADVIAMPDDAYMNETQMAYFRLKLLTLKHDILSNAGETTEHLRADTVVVPDPADRATIEEEHALELRTRDRERKLLKKIEQSIARIDSGDYGYCDETGEPIGVGRLLARPTASLSLEAQQRRELKQKMFGD
jgi:DnaK suppressor protein